MARDQIGLRIREARLRAGMSQAELADRVGVRQPTMYRYEKCGMVPGGEIMARIGATLGVSSYWLVHGEHEKPVDAPASAAGRAPPHWNTFLSSYEYLDDLSEADLQAMKSFAARTHRIRSWYDWAQLAEWLRNRKPSTIFERTKAEERGE